MFCPATCAKYFVYLCVVCCTLPGAGVVLRAWIMCTARQRKTLGAVPEVTRVAHRATSVFGTLVAYTGRPSPPCWRRFADYDDWWVVWRIRCHLRKDLSDGYTRQHGKADRSLEFAKLDSDTVPPY